MRHALENGEVFGGFLSKIEQSFNESMEQLRISLDEEITTLEKDVLESYDESFTVEEHPNPDRDQLRQELLEFTKDALTQLGGSIRGDLKAALQSSIGAPPQDVQPYLNEIDDVQFTRKAEVS